MYTHQKNIITAGKPLQETGKALIMIHGRGATAKSILSLNDYLNVTNFSFFAPQATNHSWYPYSFMAPVEQNQPALDSALSLLNEVVDSIQNQGINSKSIYLLGFSQGACLTAEFAARKAQQYGGLILFTGGLIGQQLNTQNYTGDFGGTPVLITTGDPDPHVPVSRVNETVQILEEKGATVTKNIYKGRPHTILPEEIALANKILNNAAANTKN
ncbi:alpha/beta hydrolase [Adhaeribacter radiodurans]|uniref:Dienelactone hydrolase family protein n=1 Tax=Adhaeribacter radiodurans TaxID=2745197 RepID=A0A7L7L5R1_9BACT|nr:dienelactone hydrolase family protein [Adhaeribacter radiodurans]QMU27719.1 dienelactone hydrolase family protein [Adhaeribacter radiodurans]